MPWYNDLRPVTDDNKVNYGLIFPGFSEVEKKRTLQNLLGLRKALDEQYPLKSTDGNLVIGSWNLQNFGRYSHRTPESLYYIAEIISRYDLLAIQEIKSNLEDFNKIKKILGSGWDFVINDVTGGNAGNDERFGYLYDNRKVKFGGIAGEIVLWTDGGGLSFNISQLKRTPMITGFTAGWKKFSIINLHLHPNNKLADKDLRKSEIDSLLKILTKRIDDNKLWNNNLLIMGDMNLYSDNTDAFQLFTDAGFTQAEKIKDQPTSSGEKPYDRIYFNNHDYFDLVDSANNAGVFYFDKVIYKKEDYAVYKDLMIDHKTDPTTLNTEDAFKSYFKNDWVTYQISDHFPIWIEINIDSSNKFLQKKLDEY